MKTKSAVGKHTPGPWVSKPCPELLDNIVEVMAGSAVVARAYGWVGVIGNIPANSELWRQKKLDRKSEAEANASLIASAPDIFNELESAYCQALSQFKCGDRYATFNKQTVELWGKAIAKAVGGA